jgi:hypothetical protein
MLINIIINYSEKTFFECNPHQGRAMAQAVSRRPPIAEARVQSQVSPCWIFGGQSGTLQVRKSIMLFYAIYSHVAI